VSAAGRRHADDELDVVELARWTIDRSGKGGVVLDLERMAIDSRTPFPDRDGLACDLRRIEIAG
jgi:hypothetical protein